MTPSVVVGWTEERTERAKRLWTEGKSASEIARDLGGGVTRNAVIGKLTRLGLAGSVGVTPTGEKVARRGAVSGPKPLTAPKPAKQAKPEKVSMVASRPPVDFKALAKAPDTAPAALMLKVAQLNNRTCKWPIGNVGSSHFGFCGHRVMPGQPYCAPHCKAAYKPASTTKDAQSLARSLRRYIG